MWNDHAGNRKQSDSGGLSYGRSHELRSAERLFELTLRPVEAPHSAQVYRGTRVWFDMLIPLRSRTLPISITSRVDLNYKIFMANMLRRVALCSLSRSVIIATNLDKSSDPQTPDIPYLLDP